MANSSIKANLKIVSLGVVLVAVFSLVSASADDFVDPTVGPPGGNVPAPIGRENIPQTKAGALRVNQQTNTSLMLPDGLTVFGRSNLLGDTFVGAPGQTPVSLSVTGDFSVRNNVVLSAGNADVKGTVTVRGGSPAVGSYAVSDANGTVTWRTISDAWCEVQFDTISGSNDPIVPLWIGGSISAPTNILGEIRQEYYQNLMTRTITFKWNNPGPNYTWSLRRMRSDQGADCFGGVMGTPTNIVSGSATYPYITHSETLQRDCEYTEEFTVTSGSQSRVCSFRYTPRRQ